MRIAERTLLSRLIIAILLFCSARAGLQNAPVTIAVDINLNRRPINPNIYGVADATTAQSNALNSPLNRNGGNNTTRYNWQLNADNCAERRRRRAGDHGDQQISVRHGSGNDRSRQLRAQRLGKLSLSKYCRCQNAKMIRSKQK